MDAGREAHHVIRAAAGFGVSGKNESEGVFHPLAEFLGGAFPGPGCGHPLPELGPLGDVTLAELLGFRTRRQATQATQGLVASRFQRPVLGVFSFGGVHRACVGPWE